MAFTPAPDAAAQPPTGGRVELTYVPDDAAAFLHLDAAQLLASAPVKAIRTADPKTVAGLEAEARRVFGLPPDAIRSLTLFFPRVKKPEDGEKFGLAIALEKPVDPAMIKGSFEKLLREKGGVTVHSPSPRTLVILVGLGDEYARPRPVGKPGPLHAAIREAAAGNHLFVGGLNFANLPDELRADSSPAALIGLKPLLEAESITATVDLGRDITLDVQVNTTAAKAADARKALETVAAMLAAEMDAENKEIAGELARRPEFRDLHVLLRAVQAGVKGAKVTADGPRARAVVAIPADQPFGGAFTGAAVKVREATTVGASANNLKQIGLAMHNYLSTYNTFPPAAACDKRGKPLLSWRVLILPYIEQDALFKEFRLDEPWDSEHNKKLIPKMPKIYALPGKTDGRPHETHYRVFVGPGAGFDYIRGMRIADFADGTSNTMLAVIAADSVPWTKPDELVFDPDKDMGKLLGTVPGGPYQAVYFDGSTRNFRKLPSKTTMSALITRAGGEVLPGDAP